MLTGDLAADRACRKDRRSGRRTWRWAVLTGALGLGTGALLMAPPAGAAPSASPVLVSGTNNLEGVACSSSTICFAAGSDSDGHLQVVPVHSNGTVGKVATDTSVDFPDIAPIACPSTTACYAVGEHASVNGGAVLTINESTGKPGAVKSVTTSVAQSFDGISCSSATQCETGGTVGSLSSHHAEVLPVSSGTPGKPVVISGLSGSSETTGIACVTTTCVAVGVDSGGSFVARIVGTSVKGVQKSSITRLGGIECPTSTQCYGVGENFSKTTGTGIVVPINPATGKLGSASTVPGSTVINGLACVSSTSCEGVGLSTSFKAVSVPILSGKPGNTIAESALDDLNGIGCPSTTSCFAAGEGPSGGNTVGGILPITPPK